VFRVQRRGHFLKILDPSEDFASKTTPNVYSQTQIQFKIWLYFLTSKHWSNTFHPDFFMLNYEEKMFMSEEAELIYATLKKLQKNLRISFVKEVMSR
jgi:hypothetical protein